MKIKNYLGAMDKIRLVSEIIGYSIDDFKIEPSLLELSKTVLITKYYSDFELEYTEDNQLDIIESYDKLMPESMYYDSIVSKISKYELEAIENMIKYEIQNQSGLIPVLFDKMKTFNPEETLSQLKNFDTNKYEEVANIIKNVNEV